jgi:hypothetical protein
LVPAPPEPAPGKWPTGPFTLGDPDHTSNLLRDVGFEDVSVVPYELTVVAPATAVVDPGQLELLDVQPDHDDAVAAVIERPLARFDQGDGRYAFPLAFQIVTATRP